MTSNGADTVGDGAVRSTTSTLHLKREIGFISGVAYIVGGIIGSGIFISPQGVLKNTGSVGLCLLIWMFGAVLSFLGGVTYTELMSVIRKSGGEYSVFVRTFGSLPGFVFVWTGELARQPASLAIQCLTIADYMTPLLPYCGKSSTIRSLVAVSVLVLLAMINSYSVRLTARVQIFFTLAKMSALLMIIVGGIIKISQGTVSELPSGFEGSIVSVSTLGLAFYSVMFAYGGWNNVYFLIEEVKNPERNGPLSCFLGLAIVAVVYLLTNVSYLAVMTRRELYLSTAVAQTWAEKVIGPVSWVIPVAVIVSVFGSANCSLCTTSRVQYTAARDGNWWAFLSFVQVKQYTPLPAILTRVFLGLIMTFQGTVMGLITFLSFTTWLSFGLSALSCIILRFKVKDDPKRIKVPIALPVVFMLVCCFLVLAPIVRDPQVEILYASLFLAAGIIFYFPLIYFNIKPRCIDKIEMCMQLLLEVAPSAYTPEE